MKESEYNRVANRSLAAAFLEGAGTQIRAMRMHGEMAGIHVNERVAELNSILASIASDIYSATMDDRRDLE